MTLRIGITGTMGSGKSTVARIFAALGAPVYDSDSRAKSLMMDELKSLVEAAVGCSMDDKREFSLRIFNSDELLAKVESIVHPAVVSDFGRWSGEFDYPYVVIESALLFSSPYMVGAVDKTVGVVCPIEVAIARAMARDGISRDEVVRRMARQITVEQVTQRADFIVVADEKELLVPKILSLHNNFINFVSI